MKKYCPFCDSELSETLWCEQCKRYAILYNTHNSARDDHGGIETERRELYRRLTDALKNLYAAKTKSSAPAPTPKPVLSAVPEDLSKNPQKDTPKIILIGSMLLLCFLLCLVVCAHLVLKRGAEPSGAARATRTDTQSEHNTERASESEEEPAEIILIPPEPPVESDDETSVQPADETAVPDESPAQSADETSAEKNIADWRRLEQIDPLDLQIYGGTKYYYYAAEDIEALGLQCTYYHLEITYDEAVNAVESFFGEAASEEEPFDNTYFNSYVDSGYEYYTSFQQILSYDCGGLNYSVNYDTGSGIVHFISFYGAHIEDYAELIQDISALASPEYALSLEDLLESILSTEDILLHLDPPDMWHEEYVYQDTRISLSMTYSDGTYDLQVTSREYADDVAQNTLSISRPK